MNPSEDVVRSFLGHLEAGDSHAAVALVTDDFEWRNTGMPTLRGRRATGVLLDMERRNIGFRAEIHHLAADGAVVLTDRTDYLAYGRWRAGFGVRGTFHLADGRIRIWDDAFSMGNVLGSSLKGLVGLARR